MNYWTAEQIEQILLQLDKEGELFKSYTFSIKEEHLKALGKGASAVVYEVMRCNKTSKKYALKVIGFEAKWKGEPEEFSKLIQSQQRFGYNKNVVEILDYKELFVVIDDENCVVRTSSFKEDVKDEKNCLKLQFILMEKLEPIIENDKSGIPRLKREALEHCDEAEIVKLARDIGKALKGAHDEKILHRDVKLENIFYCSKEKKYKLGDFGIAKITKDGVANTVAFTKGYGAPEVIEALDERYDNTADIYSFGMMLYVLLNDLCFPESNNYNVNTKVQYSYGYIVPKPKYGSEAIFQIIRKMCMYDPDDRYQSMDELLLDLESLVFDSAIYYKKKQQSVTYTVGTVSLLAGCILWSYTFGVGKEFSLSGFAYALIGISIIKVLMLVNDKKTSVVDWSAFILAVFFLFREGLSWKNGILAAVTMFSTGKTAFLVGGVYLTINLSLLRQSQGIEQNGFLEYRWAAIAVLAFAIVQLYQYYSLRFGDDEKILRKTFQKNRFGIMITALSAEIWLLLKIMYWPTNAWLLNLVPNELLETIYELQLDRAAGAAAISFAIWFGREMYMVKKHNTK